MLSLFIFRYLTSIQTRCGFDLEFFKVFELFLAEKLDRQRHGCLLFDEMSMRESIAVNSKTLTYIDLIDFDTEDKIASTLNEKANHGLVFIFQPLAASQPITVFASRGPMDGNTSKINY